MTGLVQTSVTCLASGVDCFQIALSAPRANALEPDLLAALHAALDKLETSGARTALLSGGKNFSTGGDVGRFLEAADNSQAVEYARKVVPALQSLVLRMIGMPVIFGCAARGAVTGGAAGLLWASDLVMLSADAFVQPYYATVGFAPDGGWTALLPEFIGLPATRRWLLADARRDAGDLVALGLADRVDQAPEDKAFHDLAKLDLDVALETKALLWDARRKTAVQDRLEAETEAFLRRIAAKDTHTKMARFLGRQEVTPNV
ncbi:enoyl-CoA hydratase/isomerase family protein [Mameliella alba]|nr:enoyl-CoA hydratase/isomerase family protein [Mameliella alba]